jgi:hypothetical protein
MLHQWLDCSRIPPAHEPRILILSQDALARTQRLIEFKIHLCSVYTVRTVSTSAVKLRQWLGASVSGNDIGFPASLGGRHVRQQFGVHAASSDKDLTADKDLTTSCLYDPLTSFVKTQPLVHISRRFPLPNPQEHRKIRQNGPF